MLGGVADRPLTPTRGVYARIAAACERRPSITHPMIDHTVGSTPPRSLVAVTLGLKA